MTLEELITELKNLETGGVDLDQVAYVRVNSSVREIDNIRFDSRPGQITLEAD